MCSHQISSHAIHLGFFCMWEKERNEKRGGASNEKQFSVNKEEAEEETSTLRPRFFFFPCLFPLRHRFLFSVAAKVECRRRRFRVQKKRKRKTFFSNSCKLLLPSFLRRKYNCLISPLPPWFVPQPFFFSSSSFHRKSLFPFPEISRA